MKRAAPIGISSLSRILLSFRPSSEVSERPIRFLLKREIPFANGRSKAIEAALHAQSFELRMRIENHGGAREPSRKASASRMHSHDKESATRKAESETRIVGVAAHRSARLEEPVRGVAPPDESPGAAIFKPSTALSTEIAGVMTPSPKKIAVPKMPTKSRRRRSFGRC